MWENLLSEITPQQTSENSHWEVMWGRDWLYVYQNSLSLCVGHTVSLHVSASLYCGWKRVIELWPRDHEHKLWTLFPCLAPKERTCVCWFFIPCVPEVQITHMFVFGALDGNRDLRQKGLIGEGRDLLNSTAKIFTCTYLSEKYSLLNPSMCDLFTTLWVHYSQFALWIWDRLLWEVTSPCVGDSHRKEPEFTPKSMDGKKSKKS